MCVLKLLLNKVNNSLKKNVSPSRTTIYLCCSNLSKTALHPPRFRSFAVAKVGIKKTSQMIWNVLGIVWE